jgi:CubicO group peptidase (beta-lactamase class C family)
VTAFDRARIERLDELMAAHVEDGGVGGLVWLAARGDEVHCGTAGVRTRGLHESVERDALFRISSMTKPMAAATALVLVEHGLLRLDDPVDGWLPELADRRVLIDGRGPIDGDTVPAIRPIVVRDLLTFELGWGMDFSAPWPQPLLDAMGELELGAGPPGPAGPPAPDEWIARLGTLPLLYQPGERWLYNTGSDVLGVLVARAAGQPLDTVMRERLFEPLGMHDTGFAATDVSRLTTNYMSNTGEPVVYDAPDGQWSKPPAFPSAAGGLVSNADDVHAFGRMLLSNGVLPDGTRLLSRSAIAAMTSDQINAGPGRPGPSIDGSQGWGFGVSVQLRRTGLAPSVGSYGWAGGLGTSWANDPSEDLVGVVLTTDAFTGPFPPPAVIQDFWNGVYAALDD